MKAKPGDMQQQHALWQDALKSAQNLHDIASFTDALAFHFARPAHYVRFFRLQVWCWLFWPARCIRIAIGRARLDAGNLHISVREALISQLIRDVDAIEFFKTPLTDAHKFRIRQKKFTHDVSTSVIQSIFRSYSVFNKKGHFIHRKQPKWVKKVFTPLRNFFLLLVMIILSFAITPLLLTGHLAEEQWRLIFLAEQFLMPAFACHTLGPHWTEADQWVTLLGVCDSVV
jgi:hypothetical protein